MPTIEYSVVVAFAFRLLRVMLAGAASAGLAFAGDQLELLNGSNDQQLAVFLIIATAAVSALTKWLRDVGVLPPSSPI